MTAAPVIVPQGKTTPPAYGGETSPQREAVIRSARARFRSDPMLQRITDEEACVNCSLREAGFEPSITPAGRATN
jgi:hypothetical protein